MIQMKIQWTASFSNALQSISGSDVESGHSIVGGINQYFTANTTDQQITLSFTLANLQGIMLLADKGCTLNINGPSGSAAQSIILQPAIPLCWGLSTGQPCPFLQDVTSAYVTNTTACRLQIAGVST